MKNKHPILFSLFCFCFFLSQLAAQSIDYRDSTITRPASYQYHAQFLGRLFLGSHYREVWAAPVTMQYFDMQHLAGGLTPLKRGGGYQTLSLRFIGADSNQYVIRTIDKDPSKAVSNAFHNTIVTAVLQDQISASHPYGFMVVPGLAKAAGIYHSNPKLLYVPNDPALGEYREIFKGQVVLFEERELSNANVEEGLSGFKKVVGTDDLYNYLHRSSDNYVDERFTVRSRLFDMMIGDWDRHEDQWRWVQFNLPDGKKMYRPIPRDRDQAFFNFDGIIPTFASLNVETTRKMQRFKPMPLSVKWFNYNARYFDRNFLSEMTRNDWMQMADTLVQLVSDKEVDEAFRIWPDTVYKLTGNEITTILKERRNNLPRMADKYYSFLSRVVTVVGTNKPDLFEVKRESPGTTDVSVYSLKNGVKGDRYYHRLFTNSETKELQLYGLDENDVFRLSGNSGSNSLVRIIGGTGKDSVIDQSKAGGGKRTRVYDIAGENYLELGKEASDKTSTDTITYSTKNFEYNFNAFFPLLGYNVDDGLFLGASVSRISNGFGKYPYKTKQSFSGAVALKTGAFSFRYRGDFTDVIGKLDLNIAANIDAPNFKQNFFGYGNETQKLFPVDDYRLRLNQVLLFPALELGDENKVRFLFGPIYQQGAVSTDTIDNFHTVFPDLTADNLSRKHYAGVNTQFTYDPFSTDTMPHFEVRFLVNLGYLKQLEDNTVNFGLIRGYISLYYHIYDKKGERLTLATRFGGGTNAGDFEFYQANVIGGRTGENVRGFRGERYSGRVAIYNNFEARLKLFHFNAYFFPADFGIIGLLDNGRVYVDDETSHKIHTGYGGGIWLNPFGVAVITATYAFSEDEKNGLLNIKLGWWF
jgi:hypothetical protein